MKYFISLCLTVLVTMLGTGPAHAIFFTDVYSDANKITSQETLIRIPELIPAYGVQEDYNETSLVLYPSHDGLGIVNQQGNFFDEVVDLQTDGGWWTFSFTVKNTSPYVWSDYHFEFWTTNFSTLLTDFPLERFPGGAGHFPEGPWSNDIFLNSAFNGSVLSFWFPALQQPGQSNTFDLTMNLDNIRGKFNDINTFGIRQVATTSTGIPLPEPTTVALVSIGLVCIGFSKHRKAV